jgi:HAD superfamily phosphatase (TIGR01668 family)
VVEALRPRLYVSSVYAINLERLKARGIVGLVVDLDNTLVAWNNDRASRDLERWVQQVKRQGFRLCLVSNNFPARVHRFGERLDVPAVPKAAKPRRRAFLQAMRMMGTDPASTAVIGDQVFTDVLGGNRLHCYTILVLPLNEREYWTTRLVRRVERLVLPSHGVPTRTSAAPPSSPSTHGTP